MMDDNSSINRLVLFDIWMIKQHLPACQKMTAAGIRQAAVVTCSAPYINVFT